MGGHCIKELPLLLLGFSAFAFLVTCQNIPKVEVKTGILEGVEIQTGAGPVMNFLGIPYAQPPVGELRFKPPEPAKKWEGVFKANSYGAPCMQNMALIYGPNRPLPPWLHGQSEDCLSINIHVPGDAIDSDANMAVMIFIHGGGYVFGSSGKNDGSFLAAKENIIFASINYRLDVFGFLTTGDDKIPGNMGLRDQILALEWIQKNIRNFGGDKDRVTVFGISAGGMSASLLSISPKSKGLITGAISESGVEYTRVLPERENLIDDDIIKEYTDKVGCTSTDDDELVSCLQNAPPEQLITQDYDVFSWLNGPIVDGKDGLIPKQPSVLWGSVIYPERYMTGIVKHEGTIHVNYLLKAGAMDFYQNGIDIDNALILVNESLQVQYADASGCLPFDMTQAIDLIKDQYFIDPGNKISNIPSLLDFFRDMNMFAPTISSLKDMTRNSDDKKGFLYYMTYTRTWNILQGAIPYGPTHGADSGFIFGRYINPADPFYQLSTPMDRAVCASMVRAWTTFAKNGKPKFLDPNDGEHDWFPYEKKNEYYLEIEANMGPGSMKEKLLPQADIFWTETFPAIMTKND